MRKKEKIIDSNRYSLILFKISQGKNYNQILSEELSIKPNALIEHLKYLEDRKFLITTRQKEYNKKIYRINWEKINDEFIKYILSKSKDPKFTISKKYAQNKYLSLFFEKLFINYDQTRSKTIKGFFESFSIALLESLAPFSKETKPQEIGEFAEFLELINPSNWEDDKFIDLSEEIMEEFSDEIDIEQTKLSYEKNSKKK